MRSSSSRAQKRNNLSRRSWRAALLYWIIRSFSPLPFFFSFAARYFARRVGEFKARARARGQERYPAYASSLFMREREYADVYSSFFSPSLAISFLLLLPLARGLFIFLSLDFLTIKAGPRAEKGKERGGFLLGNGRKAISSAKMRAKEEYRERAALRIDPLLILACNFSHFSTAWYVDFEIYFILVLYKLRCFELVCKKIILYITLILKIVEFYLK